MNRSLKFDYLYLFIFNFHLKNGFDALYFKFIEKVRMLLGITNEERVSRIETIKPESLILIFFKVLKISKAMKNIKKNS